MPSCLNCHLISLDFNKNFSSPDIKKQIKGSKKFKKERTG